MPVADTSFLVAFIDNTDTHHQSARDTLEATDHVLVNTEILIETLGVIKSRAGINQAARALQDLIALDNLGWEETCDLMAAYRIYQKHKTRSLADAIVIHHCVKHDTDPLTYDHKQARIVKRIRG